ncbi:MAG: glycosyltransferase family 4 protein [Chloroflexota bacterium]
MNILYLSQYFPPESGATQMRAFEMARNWVAAGHNVTVITEVPNHPAGVIFPTYRNRLIVRDTIEGIDVIHVWVKTAKHKTSLTRILFYVTYMINAVISALVVTRLKYDLVFASSPPLFVGAAGALIATIRKIPLIFDVRDLWPSAAVQLGELGNKSAIIAAEALERYIYRKSQLIVPVTRGLYRELVKRGVPSDKLVTITNGTNTSVFQFDGQERKKWRDKFSVNESDCLVLYAGLLGLQYDLDSLLQTAKSLNSHKNIKFVIVGDGPKRLGIEQEIADSQMTNVELVSQQPMDHMPGIYSASDISIIPLREIDLFASTIPVKLFDSWACERPVILSSPMGEASSILEEANGGIHIQPGDTEQMIEEIRSLAANSDDRHKMGISGRDYVCKHFDRAVLANKLIDRLTRLHEEGD